MHTSQKVKPENFSNQTVHLQSMSQISSALTFLPQFPHVKPMLHMLWQKRRGVLI